MILIDGRGGSKKPNDPNYYPGILHSLISNSMITTLDAGDVFFAGNGITVGIELKKVSDAVGCLYSKRLADEQIPKMKKIYDVCYLVIEGIYRSEPGTDVLQEFKWFPSSKEAKCGRWLDASAGPKRLMYSAFESWLLTLANLGGILVRNTISSETTAALLLSLFNWYQRESHQSMNVIHQAEGDGASLSRPTMLRRDLSNLPHVGWERSGILLSRVSGVRFMDKTGRIMKGSDWFIPNQIAEKSAEDIDRACNGETE